MDELKLPPVLTRVGHDQTLASSSLWVQQVRVNRPLVSIIGYRNKTQKVISLPLKTQLNLFMGMQAVSLPNVKWALILIL